MPDFYANPFDSPELYDTVIVAGVAWGPVPGGVGGKAEVSGFGLPYKWDTKDAPGTQGANDTYRGSRPGSGTIKLYAWTREHIAALGAFLALFQYDATKKTAQPVEILHPSLDAIGVHAIATDEIGQLVHEGKQLHSVTIKVHQFAPPPKKNVTASPKSSSSSTGPDGKPKPPESQSAIDKQISDLLAQAQAP